MKLNNINLRTKLRKENERTLAFLTKKYGDQGKKVLENCPAEVKKYASAKVFMENCDIAAEAVKDPVLVYGESENIQ